MRHFCAHETALQWPEFCLFGVRSSVANCMCCTTFSRCGRCILTVCKNVLFMYRLSSRSVLVLLLRISVISTLWFLASGYEIAWKHDFHTPSIRREKNAQARESENFHAFMIYKVKLKRTCYLWNIYTHHSTECKSTDKLRKYKISV